MKKLLKRKDMGYRDTVLTTAAVGGGTRSGILKTTDGGVGNKESRRGSKTV